MQTLAPMLQERDNAESSTDTTPVVAPMRRRRVLVSAIAVSPARGSEAGIGWNIGSRLAKYHDVTLLAIPGTHWPHRQETEDYIKEHGPIPGLTMHWVDATPLFWLLDRKGRSIMRPFFYFGYASWQRAVLKEVQRLHAEKPFELTHHLNILGYREPGYLWKMPIPFFWGPVAGASQMPWKFFSMLSLRDKIAYSLRNIFNTIQMRFTARPRKAAEAAAHVWAIGEDNRRMFTDVWKVPAICLCESGGKPWPQFASVKTYDPAKEPLRITWAGLHVGRKAVQLALHAVAKIGNEFPVEFTVIGAGPEFKNWRALAERLGITDKVIWTGEVPHDRAVEMMSKAHVFTFPSLLEASSTVTLEALSVGLPVICHDACGMSAIVNESCGVKLPVVSPDVSIDGYANALRRFHQNPALLTQMSQGALKRSKELSWDYAAEQIAIGYDQVLKKLERA